MNPKISVIIPTYNPKDYLWDCLESLEQQNLSKEYFEVIVVLNGEQEPYFSLITERKKNYSFQLKLLYSTQNGVSRARNLGIEQAKGKYVCFLDDDDMISSYYLQSLLDNATPNGITEANVIAFIDSNKKTTYHYLSVAYKKYYSFTKHNLVNHRSFLSSACCKLIPRNIIADFRFNENVTHGEDSLFMFQLSYKIKTLNITKSNAIYHVRVRKTSASRNSKMKLKKKKMELKLLFLYTRIFLSKPFAYNFVLYLTRIAATVRKLIRE